MRNFKQRFVWRKSFVLAVDAFKLVILYPKEKGFSLSNQITRAERSILSNIPDGSS
jgi:four helix bundle protein